MATLLINLRIHPMTTISSREFNQDINLAKRASQSSPVVITNRGKPSHVLLSYEKYLELTNSTPKLIDALAIDDDIDFDPPKSNITARPLEL